MIERDPIHLHRLVEAHQATIKRDWQATHAGPGPVRQALGRQLVHLGELLGGKPADLENRRPAGANPADIVLAPR